MLGRIPQSPHQSPPHLFRCDVVFSISLIAIRCPFSSTSALRIGTRRPMKREREHIAVTMPEQQARCIHKLNVVETIHREHHVALAKMRV